MINQLGQEIAQHWKKGDQSFIAAESYRDSVIKIKFDQFKDNSETIFAIAMELSRLDGHKAQQDITMGTKEKIEKFMLSAEFLETIELRLETLHEAIEEMYD